MNWLGLDVLDEGKTQNIISATSGETIFTGIVNVDKLEVNDNICLTELASAPTLPELGQINVYASSTNSQLYRQDNDGNIDMISITPRFFNIDVFPATVSAAVLDNSVFRIVPFVGINEIEILPSTFDKSKRITFVRDMSIQPNATVRLFLSDPGPTFDGQGYRSIFLGQGLTNVTISGNTSSIITKTPRMISSGQVIRTTDWAESNFPIFTGIPWEQFLTFFTEIFESGSSSARIRVKVKCICQLTYSISFESSGGIGPYTLSARLFNFTQNSVINGTLQTAGNFADEDTTLSFYFPGINVNTNDEIEVQIQHSAFVGNIIDASAIFTASL